MTRSSIARINFSELSHCSKVDCCMKGLSAKLMAYISTNESIKRNFSHNLHNNVHYYNLNLARERTKNARVNEARFSKIENGACKTVPGILSVNGNIEKIDNGSIANKYFHTNAYSQSFTHAFQSSFLQCTVLNENVRLYTTTRYYGKDASNNASTSDRTTQKPQNAQQIQNPYILSLRKFFLQVHPDFFEGDQDKQIKNQESFVKLNQILDWLSQLKVNPQVKIIPTPIELYFHLRKSDRFVKVVFNLNKEKFPISRERAEFLVDKCVHSLLIQAGVALPEGLEDRDFEAEEEAMSDKKFEPRRQIQSKKKKDNLREELRLAVVNDLYKRDSNLVKYGWWTETLPEVDALIELNMLLFHKDISPLQSMEAIENVRMHLQDMKYHLWSDIPIMFGKKYDCTSIKGVIIVPFNFETSKFVRYIEENADKARKLSEEVQNAIDDFESRVTKIQTKLKLDNLTFSVPNKIALQAIDRLVPIVDSGALDMFPLKGVHLVIGDEFYFDFNNACIGIAHDFKDADEFVRFFKFLTNDNIEACAKKNIEDKEVIAEANAVAMDIMSRLGCLEFNIDKYCASSPSKKLKCLHRLKDYCMMLKQYGWDEYAIYLSDEVINVEVDRDNRVIHIPLEFSEGDLYYQATTAATREKAISEGRVVDKSGNVVPEEFTELFKFQEEMEREFNREMEKAKEKLEDEARKIKEIEETERRVTMEKEVILRREFKEEIEGLLGEFEFDDLEDILSAEDIAFLKNENQEQA